MCEPCVDAAENDEALPGPLGGSPALLCPDCDKGVSPAAKYDDAEETLTVTLAVPGVKKPPFFGWFGGGNTAVSATAKEELGLLCPSIPCSLILR